MASCIRTHGAVASCVRVHSSMVNCVRVKQVASEASTASSASGRSGRFFFFLMFSPIADAAPEWDHDTDTLASFLAWRSATHHIENVNQIVEALLGYFSLYVPK